MRRAVCILVATGMLAVGCGDESEEASPSSGELANGNDLSACLSNAGLESRSGGFFVGTGGDVAINGQKIDIGPVEDPDASALVLPAKQADEAEKFEAALPEAQLVRQNVLVTPPSLDVLVGSKPAGEPVPEEIVDQVRVCVSG